MVKPLRARAASIAIIAGLLCVTPTTQALSWPDISWPDIGALFNDPLPEHDGPVSLDTPHRVKDLAYGDFLYDYFQQHYFSAITKAMIAEQRGQLKHHGEHSELLLGSLYLDYGLLDDAEDTFKKLLEKHTTNQEIREKVWYQLARLYYKRGDTKRSISIMDSYLKSYSPSIQVQVELLYTLNYLADEQLEQALVHLNTIKDTENLGPFAYLNLGIVHSLLGNHKAAEQNFGRLIRLKGTSELLRNVKDRAALAMGKHFLVNGDYQNAQSAFKLIRREGETAEIGMLGLGWAQFKSEQPEQALTPWITLVQSGNKGKAVNEAYINIPYAYETLGDLPKALEGYQSANTFYGTRQTELDTIIERIETTDWLDQLTPIESFSFDPMAPLSPFVPPEEASSKLLYKEFASNAFNEAYREYREVQRLLQVLHFWRQQIPTYSQIIENHVQRVNNLSERSTENLERGNALLSSVSARVERINQQLKTAKEKGDTRAIAGTEQLNLITRMDRLVANANALPDTPEYQADKQRVKLLQGLLNWDLSVNAAAEQWSRTKDVLFLKEQLEVLEQRITAVNTARQTQNDRFAGFEQRIKALEGRMDAAFLKGRSTLVRHQLFLQSIAVDRIRNDKEHLRRLQANTIYSIARLQDVSFSQYRERKFKMLGEPVAPGEENADTATPENLTQDTNKPSAVAPAVDPRLGTDPTLNDEKKQPDTAKENPKKAPPKVKFEQPFKNWMKEQDEKPEPPPAQDVTP